MANVVLDQSLGVLARRQRGRREDLFTGLGPDAAEFFLQEAAEVGSRLFAPDLLLGIILSKIRGYSQSYRLAAFSGPTNIAFAKIEFGNRVKVFAAPSDG